MSLTPRQLALVLAAIEGGSTSAPVVDPSVPASRRFPSAEQSALIAAAYARRQEADRRSREAGPLTRPRNPKVVDRR